MLAAGPALGEDVPALDVQDINGRRIELGSARGMRTLLVFVSAQCDSCETLAPAIRSIAKSENHRTVTILVSSSDADDIGRFAVRNGLTHVPIVASRGIVEAYGVHGTPFALLVGTDGKLITKGIVNHVEHLSSLINADELGVDSAEQFHDRSHGRNEPVGENQPFEVGGLR